MKTRVRYFIRIHISYGLRWFGVVAKNTARLLNPTLHRLFIEDKDHIFLQVWIQEARMMSMSRAFVFLNCDIAAETRAVNRKCGASNASPKPVRHRSSGIDFGDYLVMRI